MTVFDAVDIHRVKNTEIFVAVNVDHHVTIFFKLIDDVEKEKSSSIKCLPELSRNTINQVKFQFFFLESFKTSYGGFLVEWRFHYWLHWESQRLFDDDEKVLGDAECVHVRWIEFPANRKFSDYFGIFENVLAFRKTNDVVDWTHLCQWQAEIINCPIWRHMRMWTMIQNSKLDGEVNFLFCFQGFRVNLDRLKPRRCQILVIWTVKRFYEIKARKWCNVQNKLCHKKKETFKTYFEKMLWQGSGTAKVANTDTTMRFAAWFFLYASLLRNRHW